MKFGSRFFLFLAKKAPRGYYKILKFAATRDPSLRDMPLPLRDIPFSLRGDLRESVFTTLYRTGGIPHQAGFDRICQCVLRAGDTVFDIGANIGYTAALFSHLVGPGGRVVAVEPSPRSFAFLTRSMGSVENTKLLNLGISSEKDQLVFYVPRSLDRASFIPIADAEKLEVNVVSLDDLCAVHGHPNAIKIDVEGYEPSVLEGATNTLLRDDRPIIIFEALTAECLERCIIALSERSSGNYEYRRINNDGTLGLLGTPGSSDFIAIPKWAEERLGRILREKNAA